MNHVEVYQITSKGNTKYQAYFNVDSQFGHVAVSTYVNDRIVILVKHKLNIGFVGLIAFDSIEFFEEWKKDYSNAYNYEVIKDG